MTDTERDILAALDVFEWRSLTEIAERSHVFRRRIEYAIKPLIESGVVQFHMRTNDRGNYQIGMYRLAEVAHADPA
jgi:predicted transcriptional regulator